MKDRMYEEILEAAIEVAKSAGEITKIGFYSEKSIKTKAGFADLVTETDEKVEAHVIDTLREKFPGHAFIGEESDAAGKKAPLTDNPTWIIDPVDGTTNFVHGIPHTCISIGFWVDKQPKVGVVYNAILNELYTAVIGQGAQCNGLPLKVSGITELNQSILICEAGASKDTAKIENIFKNMQEFCQDIHGFRSFGSAALNMCYVAKGSAEAYYEYGLHCWDMAAAALIVIEAGGVVVDPTGSDLDVMSRRVLCASSQQLVNVISPRLSHLSLPRD